MKIKKIAIKKQVNLLQSSVWMKCLDCVCCQPKEVILCQTQGCPLWEYRPKKNRGLYTLMKKLKQKNLGLYEANKS